ncbi:hypothetical protein P691DRAFT_805350 [Macrolepiota fuliginosa MF-IS2]|uniref:Uncharacterized protein n=1 Tax=Macrolepiota fuliginosa MF-IS2 TaxID=1400762 RepID=A0A9P5XKM0_9AGAR|nr:hypothetical protein P691DRAFT_805350 [Macrolepiota fuliginosa MF-IS2]
MLALMAVSSCAAIVLVYFLMPALWLHIMSADDSLDAHEAGLALVASRNPFRESGPPANMAKLILLRHKIQTNNRRRRSPSHSRQVPRTYNPNNMNRGKAPWVRFGRSLSAKQYH